MSGPGLIGAGPAPIARVAGDAATVAAFDAVADELHRARAEGRLVQTLPLTAVQDDYLVRDRILAEDEDFAALMASLRARGQQAPIDVVHLGDGRFGLISGWRRLTALRLLLAETGEARFGTVQALLRRPADAADAYVAMVEENEIRLGLSYYERARIVAKLVEQGVFETAQRALQSLFSTASRAKRSKIGSFMGIVTALDSVLSHPSRIPERLGLALAQALTSDPGLAARISDRLRASGPLDAEAEQALLAALVAEAARPERVSRAKPAPGTPSAGAEEGREEVVAGIFLRVDDGCYILSGPGADAAFGERLVAWLQQRERG
jgi:ParB family transcriptional regulator, chromosome partitioning protein